MAAGAQFCVKFERFTAAWVVVMWKIQLAKWVDYISCNRGYSTFSTEFSTLVRRSHRESKMEARYSYCVICGSWLVALLVCVFDSLV
jgi:hypothetical protein